MHKIIEFKDSICIDQTKKIFVDHSKEKNVCLHLTRTELILS